MEMRIYGNQYARRAVWGNQHIVVTQQGPDSWQGERVDVIWSAIGEVTVEKAAEFALALVEAVELAKEWEATGFVVTGENA